MWKLLLVGVNYLASLLDTCIFRPEWLSDQNTIFHMLEEAVSHQELGNQRWASPNPPQVMAVHQTHQAPLAWEGRNRARGLCLASINRQFVQSAFWIKDWISFTTLETPAGENKCYKITAHSKSNVNDNASRKNFSRNAILPLCGHREIVYL